MRRRAWVGLLLLGMLAGCGRPGFPVPPDDYGIGARMQLERKKEEQAKKEQDARREASTQAREAAKPKADEGVVTPPDEVILPDMRPVGGR